MSKSFLPFPICTDLPPLSKFGSSEACSVSQATIEQGGQSEVVMEERPVSFLTPLEHPVLCDVPSRRALVLVSKSNLHAVVF